MNDDNKDLQNINQIPQDNQLLLPKAHQTIEFEKDVSNGYCMLCFDVLLILIFILSIVFSIIYQIYYLFAVNFLIFFSQCFIFKGFFTNTPNDAHVITYFGKYIGSVKKVGFFWINPFYSHFHIELKRRIEIFQDLLF